MSARRLRIVLAGEWRADIHEAAWATGLRALGHVVEPFSWGDRLGGTVGRVQNRLLWGPAIWRLNAALVRTVLDSGADALLVYRGTHILPETYRELRRLCPSLAIVSYNNDDPFSTRAATGLWRHYRGSIREWDAALVYRQKNLADHEAAGARRVRLVRSAFIPEKDRPVELSAADRERLGSDVLFAGHYEPDGRERFLLALADAGVRVRLMGPEWNRLPPELVARLRPEPAPRGEDYVRAVAGTRIALCFLSTLNNDTYTRRCFEVPAIGTMLLCQRTAEMESLFSPGVEADYFSTPEELVEKIQTYLADDGRRLAIATAGHAKVRSAGHDIYSRMREVEAVLLECMEGRVQ